MDLTFILIIYVDDLIFVCDSMKKVEDFKARISQESEMKYLGEIKHALGIKVDYQREKGIMYLIQEEFAEAILERSGMHESNPVATPIEKRRSLKEPINDALRASPGWPLTIRIGMLSYA